MSDARIFRGVRSRTTSLVAILVLTVALAAFLAFEAWDAAHRHRVTAERAMTDYAKFAAWEFSASAKEQLYSTLVWAFSPTGTIDARDLDGPLPGPSILDHEKSSHLLCARDSSRYFFRLDMRDGSFVTSGEEPATSMRKWMLDTLPRNAKTYKSDWVYEVVSGSVDGHSRSIVYQLKRDRAGRPAVAYGFEFCFAQFAIDGLKKVMRHYAILPPSLTGGVPNESVPNDSIFSARVFDGNGHLIFQSEVQYPPTYVGAYKIDYFGGLKSVVALRPTLAKALLIGELPSERLPLLLGVLGLSVVLAAIGVMQLRRESELARLRSDFIASVSHELRTPLAQVRMFAETLRLGRIRTEGERARSLEIIDQEARRLTHLVENILLFSRAERHQVRLSPRPCVLAAEVREALQSFAPIAAARHVRIVESLDDDACAMVDVEAFRQIVLNLVDNAIKYSPSEGTVRVSLAPRGAVVRLEVVDEGPGIPPADVERIWTPYFRLERDVSSAVAGSGIGLAVVRDLVQRHGGRTGVERQGREQRGSHFFVELPRSPNAEADAGPESGPTHEELEPITTESDA